MIYNALKDDNENHLYLDALGLTDFDLLFQRYKEKEIKTSKNLRQRRMN
jgi:hypothetical protein